MIANILRWIEEKRNRRSPLDIMKLAYVQKLMNADREHLVMFNLETLEYQLVSVGDENGVKANELVVLLCARKLQCRHIVILHNHPAIDGEINPRPSYEDLGFTEFIANILEQDGKKLVDHLVVSKRGTYSYNFRRLIQA